MSGGSCTDGIPHEQIRRACGLRPEASRSELEHALWWWNDIPAILDLADVLVDACGRSDFPWHSGSHVGRFETESDARKFADSEIKEDPRPENSRARSVPLTLEQRWFVKAKGWDEWGWHVIEHEEPVLSRWEWKFRIPFNVACAFAKDSRRFLSSWLDFWRDEEVYQRAFSPNTWVPACRLEPAFDKWRITTESAPNPREHIWQTFAVKLDRDTDVQLEELRAWIDRWREKYGIAEPQRTASRTKGDPIGKFAFIQLYDRRNTFGDETVTHNALGAWREHAKAPRDFDKAVDSIVKRGAALKMREDVSPISVAMWKRARCHRIFYHTPGCSDYDHHVIDYVSHRILDADTVELYGRRGELLCRLAILERIGLSRDEAERIRRAKHEWWEAYRGEEYFRGNVDGCFEAARSHV